VPPAPAIVVDNQGHQWVFVRGTDGALWGRHEVDGWFSLGGQISSGPDALVTVDGRILVVARGLDGATWQIERDADGTWGNWSSLGGLS
jgi:alpha-galactosidase